MLPRIRLHSHVMGFKEHNPPTIYVRSYNRKNVYYLHHIHLSVCPPIHLSTFISVAPTGLISVKFYKGGINKKCLGNPNLATTRQKYQVLYMKT